eukprot:TRINITY_DN8264_c0_g2_i1.p1 TRINITY_DN8264_c0_g2~~TRINITY_DN8264_c0_g2_i1.p1  ORF type:complete len:235 (-),score=16.57 TRINITY_DN8264_c0_g2_i1:93-737(-)
MECVVQGVIDSKHVRALAELVRGMTGAGEERVDVHQMAFKNAANVGAIPCQVKLECTLNTHPPMWTIVHHGGAMRGTGADQLAAAVRSVVRVRAAPAVLQLLPALGLRLDHELVRRGVAFSFAHRGHSLRLEACTLLRLPRQHAVSEAEQVPQFAGLHAVELTVQAAAESYVDASTALNSFAELIGPLVRLSKPNAMAGLAPSAANTAAAISRG